MIIVKKYGNRRLYDSNRSCYINLEQLADLIRGGETVQVQDVKTGEDLTQEVLLQVVMEVLRGTDVLSVDMLHRIIKSTGSHPWNHMVHQQLVAGMKMVSSQMEQAERMMRMGAGVMGEGWSFDGAAKPQRAAHSPAPPPVPDPPVPDPPVPEPPTPEPPPEPEPAPGGTAPGQQLDELKARLEELEKLLRG